MRKGGGGERRGEVEGRREEGQEGGRRRCTISAVGVLTNEVFATLDQ